MKTVLLVILLQMPGMTNQEVVDLVKFGISAEIIKAKIKSSCNFDTSVKALTELKTAGVPDAVMLAMVEAPCAERKPVALAKPGARNLEEVRRIYIGEMGKEDEAERFRSLLREKLSEHFTVTDTAEDADSILKGVVATQLSEGTTQARASVTLTSLDGRTLWSDNFGVHWVWSASKRRDSVNLRAEDVANGLYSAWKKANKKPDK